MREVAHRRTASTRKGVMDYGINLERFVYEDGAHFVARVQRAGGWRLVDSALTSKPAVSSEQVLHPETYLQSEPAEPIRPSGGSVAGPKFRRLAAGAFGDFDTALPLVLGAGADDDTTRAEAAEAAEAAAGWAGGRYELWRVGSRGCKTPCLAREVRVLTWRWDSARDAQQFAQRLKPYLADYQRLRQTGPGAWSGGVAKVVVVTRGTEARLVAAPALGLARLVAARA